MKKAALIVLTALYMMSVSGISVNRFYCCGKLESTSFSAFVFGKSATKDDGCCKHRQNVVKVSDSHEAGATMHVGKACITDAHYSPVNYNVSSSLCKLPAPSHNQINAPPLIAAIPLYTRFCNYRI